MGFVYQGYNVVKETIMTLWPFFIIITLDPTPYPECQAESYPVDGWTRDPHTLLTIGL